MDGPVARALADVRRAVALAHALPHCVVELEGAAGEPVRLGFGAYRCLRGTPCDLRAALQAVLEGFDGGELTLLGVPLGPVAARIVVDDDEHVGLGVYRYRTPAAQGYVLASLAPAASLERRLREAVTAPRAGALPGGETPDGREVWLVHDTAIGVSLVFVEYPPLPLLVEGCAEERAALAIAAACLAAEVESELEELGGDPGTAAR